MPHLRQCSFSDCGETESNLRTVLICKKCKDLKMPRGQGNHYCSYQPSETHKPKSPLFMVPKKKYELFFSLLLNPPKYIREHVFSENGAIFGITLKQRTFLCPK